MECLNKTLSGYFIFNNLFIYLFILPLGILIFPLISSLLFLLFRDNLLRIYLFLIFSKHISLKFFILPIQ
jgi:hypothetical protein